MKKGLSVLLCAAAIFTLNNAHASRDYNLVKGKTVATKRRRRKETDYWSGHVRTVDLEPVKDVIEQPVKWGSLVAEDPSSIYVGSGEELKERPNSQAFALSRIQIDYPSGGLAELRFIPLAPKVTNTNDIVGSITVNGVVNQTVGATSPLWGERINLLTVGSSGQPVVNIASKPDEVFLITNISRGIRLLKNDAAFTIAAEDFSTTFPATTMHALAATRNAVPFTSGGTTGQFIFSFISDSSSGSLVDATRFSIAVARVDDDNLTFLDVRDFNNVGFAAPYALTNSAIDQNTPVAFENNAKVHLFYDEQSKLFFLHFNGIKSGTASSSALGTLGILFIDATNNGALGGKPLFELGSSAGVVLGTSTLTQPRQNVLVAQGDGSSAGIVDVHHLRIMQTTTKKFYLITVGGTRVDGDPISGGSSVAERYRNNTAVWVNAIPLVSDRSDENFGRVENKPLLVDREQFPETFTEDQKRIVVGSHPRNLLRKSLSSDWRTRITDIKVVNDCVFVSLSSDSDDGSQGIWKSTAVFNESGEIKSWTPWEQVAAQDNIVGNFFCDTRNGTEIFLTTPDGSLPTDQDTAPVTGFGTGTGVGTGLNPFTPPGSRQDFTTIKVTDWNRGQESGDLSTLSLRSPDGNYDNLIDLLAAEIGQGTFSTPGFLAFSHVDPLTPGLMAFDINQEPGHVAFNVFTGFGQVLLATSAQRDDDGVLQEPETFCLGQNVFVFPRPGDTRSTRLLALGSGGSLITADFSKWLIVGGSGPEDNVITSTASEDRSRGIAGSGLLVLSKFDGSGVENLDRLGGNEGQFPGSLDETMIMDPMQAEWNFTPIVGSEGEVFSDVRKVIIDPMCRFMYVMTGKKVFRVRMKQENFSNRIDTSQTDSQGNVLMIPFAQVQENDAEGVTELLTVAESNNVDGEPLFPSARTLFDIFGGGTSDATPDGFLYDIMILETNRTTPGGERGSRIAVFASNGVYINQDLIPDSYRQSSAGSSGPGTGTGTGVGVDRNNDNLKNIRWQNPIAGTTGTDADLRQVLFVRTTAGGLQEDASTAAYVFDGCIQTISIDTQNMFRADRFVVEPETSGDVTLKKVQEPFLNADGSQADFFVRFGSFVDGQDFNVENGADLVAVSPSTVSRVVSTAFPSPSQLTSVFDAIDQGSTRQSKNFDFGNLIAPPLTFGGLFVDRTSGKSYIPTFIGAQGASNIGLIEKN